jgi:hypothetical protein
MSRTNTNQKVAAVASTAQDRAREVAAKVKPAAAQVKPLAKSTQEAARRGLLRTRTWAAPQIERSGQVLQEDVAPKVADMLSSAARRIEPDKPRRRRWWMLPGVAVLLAAAASAAAAALRKRSTSGSTTAVDEADAPDKAGTVDAAAAEPEPSANADGSRAGRGS